MKQKRTAFDLFFEEIRVRPSFIEAFQSSMLSSVSCIIGWERKKILFPNLTTVAKVLNIDVESTFKYLRKVDRRYKHSHNLTIGEISDIEIDRTAMSHLVKKNRSLLKGYFYRSLNNYSRLSHEDRTAFDEFIKHFARKRKRVRSWKDINLSKIDRAFFRAIYKEAPDVEVSTTLELEEERTLNDIRSSGLYLDQNESPLKKYRKIHLRFTLEVFITHRYHIFTSEDSEESIVCSTFCI